MNNIIFSAMFIIVPILAVVIFGFTIAMMISPKLRGKMMSREIKARKYMMEESKDDIRDISNNMAYATKDGIKVATGAIRDGFKQDTLFCKHCGNEIDADSKFCKVCGKEQ